MGSVAVISDPITTATEALRRAGVSTDAVAGWRSTAPPDSADFAADCDRYSRFWQAGNDLLAALPRKPERNEVETQAAEQLLLALRQRRSRFLSAHADALYDRLTTNRGRFVRVEHLAYEAAEAVPGLAPTRQQVLAESEHPQRDKDGLEIDQGILLAHVLASPRAGRHLCHAMLLPREEALARLPDLERQGRVDLGQAEVVRQGPASVVYMKNPRYLNAEDQTTIDPVEIAVDLATLDPRTQIAVLRGGAVEHPKWRGRRVFGTGINLTHLYWGKVPYLWYLQRELGFVSKFYRGLARPEIEPDEATGDSIEKLWVAAVEAFAIGGHCQYLLAIDFVIAAEDAYLTLPARKEGIVPGAANLRLPRFVGDRIARQAIQYQRRLDCASPEGRLICDEVVSAADMDAALERVTRNLTGSGVVSAVANRRALRVGQEPLDLFRSYCAVYAREQAYAHFSRALIENLERYWDAQNRKPE